MKHRRGIGLTRSNEETVTNSAGVNVSHDPIPRYKWRVTWPNPEDADSHKTDFQGWDGDVAVGRIRYEPHGPKRGFWLWTGHGPRKGIKSRLAPHQGYEPSARKAAEKAEDYYERLMTHNGLKTGQA